MLDSYPIYTPDFQGVYTSPKLRLDVTHLDYDLRELRKPDYMQFDHIFTLASPMLKPTLIGEPHESLDLTDCALLFGIHDRNTDQVKLMFGDYFTMRIQFGIRVPVTSIFTEGYRFEKV